MKTLLTLALLAQTLENPREVPHVSHAGDWPREAPMTNPLHPPKHLRPPAWIGPKFDVYCEYRHDPYYLQRVGDPRIWEITPPCVYHDGTKREYSVQAMPPFSMLPKAYRKGTK